MAAWRCLSLPLWLICLMYALLCYVQRGAFYRAMGLLTVASPCALVMVPLAYVSAIAAIASRSAELSPCCSAAAAAVAGCPLPAVNWALAFHHPAVSRFPRRGILARGGRVLGALSPVCHSALLTHHCHPPLAGAS